MVVVTGAGLMNQIAAQTQQQTYKDPEGRFTIQYPSNWQIAPKDSSFPYYGTATAIAFKPTSEGKDLLSNSLFSISLTNVERALNTTDLKVKPKSLDQIVSDSIEFSNNPSSVLGDMKVEVLKKNPITIGGFPALQVQYLTHKIGTFDMQTLVIKNNRLYTFLFSTPELRVPETLPVAQSMLKTFQFTGNNTLADNRSSEVASNTKSLTMPNNVNSNKTDISSSSSSASVSNSANVNRTISENIGTNTSTVSKTSTTVTSIQTTMTLLDDAIQALHEKNNDKALVHLNLIRQNLASLLSSITSPPVSNITASRSLSSTQAAVRPQTEACKTLPSSKATGATTSSTKSSPVQQIPSTASDFKNHDPCTITLDFLKVSNANFLNDYELKGELTNTGKQTLNGFRIHMHWYDKGMNIVGFNDGQNGVYTPSDTIAPRQTISFDFLQSGTNDFTGVPAFLKLSYDWR